MKKQIIYGIGLLFLALGIYFSIFQKLPHFFSLGLFLITYQIYNSIAKEKLFHKWKTKQYAIFFITLLISCVIIDHLGLVLNYWNYQYSTLFDEIIKYILEWEIPLISTMILFMIGEEIFKKKFSILTSQTLSLLTFIIILGIIIEYLNHFADSWIITNMPFTNIKIGNYFLIFQTIGYWLMAIIPYTIYKFTDKIK